MGWYESIFGASKPQATDPLGKLDPKLREYLERESPVKLKPPSEPQPIAKPPASTSPDTKTQTQTDAPTEAAARPLPKDSAFQDGRYAHLWKTYRPLSEIEAESKTDHEKLSDVLEAYKSRKAEIGRAALENCAFEQLDWRNCMHAGDWGDKFTMCSKEVRKFERCYTMQARLLKTLGYLSTYERPASVDEEIQMHADRLYHRMLDQEAQAEQAKKEGKEAPKFPPLIDKRVHVGRDDPTSKLSPETVKAMKDALAKLPEGERAAAEEAMKAELLAKVEVASRVRDIWKEKDKEREERKAAGQATFYDKLADLTKKQ